MAGTLNKGSIVKNPKSSGGGGSARFPTIVTSSGSSLPVDLTGYNEGDTFLIRVTRRFIRQDQVVIN